MYLTNATTGMNLSETVWKLADPPQAISVYEQTAQNCSFTANSGNQIMFRLTTALDRMAMSRRSTPPVSRAQVLRGQFAS